MTEPQTGDHADQPGGKDRGNPLPGLPTPDDIRVHRDLAVAASEILHPFRPLCSGLQVPADTFAGPDAAIRWWRKNRTAVNACSARAAELGLHVEAWHIAEAAWGPFLRDRDCEPFLELCLGALASAGRSGRPTVTARLHLQIAFAHTCLERHDEADAHNAAAAEIGEGEQHIPTQAAAISRSATRALRLGNALEALDLYEESARLHSLIDRPRGIGLARRRRGEVLTRLRRYDEAETELAESAGIMAAAGDLGQRAKALVALAEIHELQGHYAQAHEEMLSALSDVEPLGNHFRITVLTALANIEHRHGDDEKAAARAEEITRLLSMN